MPRSPPPRRACPVEGYRWCLGLQFRTTRGLERSVSGGDPMAVMRVLDHVPLVSLQPDMSPYRVTVLVGGSGVTRMWTSPSGKPRFSVPGSKLTARRATAGRR